MPITVQQLLQILPNASRVAGVFVPVLNTAMSRYQIVGTKRIAAFVAQVGHESGHLTRLVENLNYSADGLANTWSSRYAEPDGKGGYIKVQVAGKVRDRLEVSPDISEADLRELALATPGVVKALEGKGIKTVIVRPPKLVNVVPE